MSKIIQLGEFHEHLGPIIKNCLSFTKNLLTPQSTGALIPTRLTAVVLATDAAIQERN